ncbi:hypothetical protein BDV30DRAFT_6203 [Aspergillus minisclerotigenes]|uniref:Secreted protein n=1 Tax=Aspergillus minisclerotigenes TaxID=656917 RepID=A0A5N6JLH8_9EURO|nr:hypothetical protein BDV30DRAFT_6203 [Aspergillus minisclerotigenes]
MASAHIRRYVLLLSSDIGVLLRTLLWCDGRPYSSPHNKTNKTIVPYSIHQTCQDRFWAEHMSRTHDGSTDCPSQKGKLKMISFQKPCNDV